MHYQPLAVAQRLGGFHAAGQPESAGRDELQVHVSSGVAVVLLVAQEQQDVRHPGLLYALRSGIQHRVSSIQAPCRRKFRAIATIPTPAPLSSIWRGRMASVLLRSYRLADRSLFPPAADPPATISPSVKLWVPLGKHVSWFQQLANITDTAKRFYLYEGFRTNLVTTGVRLTR